MVPGLGPGLGDGGGKGQRRHMVSALGSCYLSPKGQGLRMSPGVVATGGGGEEGACLHQGRSWSSHTSPGSMMGLSVKEPFYLLVLTMNSLLRMNPPSWLQK